MPRSLFSPSWYRVAELRPRLRPHIELHRQRFRGQIWFVMQDHASGRFHRFTPSAHLLIGLMNGGHTINQIWEMASDRLGDDLPTQDEVIRLLAQLHMADVLQTDVPPDVLEVAKRADQQELRELLLKIRNPMALRFPLFDPDRFLTATLPLVRWLFSPVGFLLWLGLVGWAGMLAVLHWHELTTGIVDRALAVENILLMMLVYPAIKALHELGHGYAVKRWGGEVHEMGVMLLVLMPVPYVDASSSSAFGERLQRMVVGAAGIMVEVALASLGMMLWLNAEHGLVHAVAFNLMLIGGVSTVLFNGNPLLRFDGYYVLADLLEIPNLGIRAGKYLLYLLQRYLFGLDEEESPATAPGEPFWFVVYGVASFLYRLSIMVAISLFIATKFFFIGVLLALWALAVMLATPAFKAIKYLATSPALYRKRRRAIAWSGGLLAAAVAILTLLPLPLSTLSEGLVWVPERARVLAATDGNVTRILAPLDSQVAAGTPLLQLEDPYLAAHVRVLEAELKEFRLRLVAMEVGDRVQAGILRERVRAAAADLDLAKQRAADLLIRSPVAGRFVVPDGQDLVGHFVAKGDLVAYVIDPARPTVRVVVPQARIDLVRHRTRAIAVRFSDHIETVVPAAVSREVPSASRDLPGAALSSLAGGEIAIDPRDKRSVTALENVFQLDIGFARGITQERVGGRVHVRFDHGAEPILFRIYRSMRQLFLRHFNV